MFFSDQPTTHLKMGSSLNPDDIKEGDDVYFECVIQSNPKPYKMSWFHNVSLHSFTPTSKANIHLNELTPIIRIKPTNGAHIAVNIWQHILPHLTFSPLFFKSLYLHLLN